MSKADEYTDRARLCLELAKASDDPHTKASMLEMAHAWVKLAMRALKGGETTPE